jgi:hypothetical protein
VVADIIDASKHVNARKWLSWQDCGAISSMTSGFLEPLFIRTKDDPAPFGASFPDASSSTGSKAARRPSRSVHQQNKAESLLKNLHTLSAFRIIS